MANAPGIEFHEKLSDITECSICAEIFTNPKILPCVHTFCLHCLEKYGKHKKPGNKMTCPICRNEFSFPDKGLSDLPNNFFIGKIVEIGKLAAVTAKEEVCDLCMEETAIAKMFCIECEQKICERCSTLHRRMKQCQSHQVIELGSQLNVQELNSRRSYCEHHPQEVIKMYCYDDSVAICLICCVESHQSHKCSAIDKAAGELTEQLKADQRKVAVRLPDCEEAFQKLEKYKKEFSEEVLETEESIRKSGTELKHLIDQHTQLLVQNLRVVRDRNMKCFEMTKQDVCRFKVMLDSYQRYCDELLTKGSLVDICRASGQIHTRANDLEQLPANCGVDDFYCDKIAFNCSNIEILMNQHQTNNAVGELAITKSNDRTVKFQKGNSEKNIPDNWETMTDAEEFKTIQLSASDQEYQDIAEDVLRTAQSTFHQIGLVKIERIQSKTFYKHYLERKAAMVAANPGIQNELTLYHGTGTARHRNILEIINRTGFNRAYCGINGPYGSGIYFSMNFGYSAQNAGRSPEGFKLVYQCKVLTGTYAAGNRRMTAPLLKPDSNNLLYDSTVDNVANPTVFVKYCESDAYPEYLIYFK